MNNYSVYLHRNKINGKIYIGQTKQELEKRWMNGEGYSTSPRFYNAIQKYGWDNFDHIVLKSNLSQEEANRFEEQLIAQFNSQNEEFGYNIKAGGNNNTLSEETKRKIGLANSISLLGNTWSEEQKEKMSKLFSGEGNPFYGKRHTKETKKKISDNRKGKTSGELHPMYGKHHLNESLIKMSENRQSKGGKRVLCVNTGEIFDCMMDAARWCGLTNSSSIGQVCNKTGKQKTAGKHPVTNEKLMWEFLEEDRG